MKINIYYGGRGLIGDPTLFVIQEMQKVFEELNVTTERYDLCEMKNTIVTLPQTLKDADGIVLASTVEWYGIGGYMQQFLDACWLYGDKDIISRIYMCPVVMSTTYGEREGKLNLSVAWEILGGLPCSGICGYIPEVSELECKKDYLNIIDKKAENMYRTINQRVASFPASNQAVKQKVSFTQNTDLTPQETEQLSVYASDEGYVQRQKEDIKELTDMFRDMLEHRDTDQVEVYPKLLKENFKPLPGFHAVYRIHIENSKKELIIRIDNAECDSFYGKSEFADVDIHTTEEVMEKIFATESTFQRSFMAGEMKIKGDFKVLRTLDQIFVFKTEKKGM